MSDDYKRYITTTDAHCYGYTVRVPLWRKLWYRICERLGWKKPYFALKDWKL
jgi:hypothetical protein